MIIKHSNTSNIIRFTIKNSSTGVGLTGLTEASAGLIISTICNNEATATTYTQAGATIETIAALGTYAAPTATKCRFKEVDATNHKGLYEFQIADARYAIASARSVVISVTGASSLLDTDYEIQLVSFDPHDAIRMGMTSLPNAVVDAAGGLPISDAGGLDLDTKLANTNEITAARMGALTDWINGGRLDLLLDAIPTTAMRGTDNAALASGVDLTSIHGVALTETVNGYLAAAFVKLFDVVTPVLTTESVNQSANNNTILAHADYGLAQLVRSTTPANKLDVSSTGEAGLDFANIKNATGAHTLTNITVPTVSTLTGKTGFALSSTGANLILKDSTFALAIADAIWDEVLTGVTHNIANSAGRRVREIGAFAIESGTAQAGTSTSITLAATANGADGIFNRNLIVLTDNTGKGQTRTIVDYNSTSKVCVIDREWRITPDNTTAYQITPDDTPLVVDHGVAQAGSTATTIKLRAYASSDNDNYLCNIVSIIAGTGRGQARLVGSYDGTTKVVTICGDNWVTIPDDTSIYAMMPYGAACVACINSDALAQINTEVDNALNTAIPGSPTADSINQRVKAIDDLSQASGSGDLAAIKVKADSLPSGIAKNVALSAFTFYIVLSSDHVSAATGKTLIGQISKDGGAFAGLTNSITEIGNGLYKVDIIQAEMNADVVTLKFTETDCDQRVLAIYTS